MVTLPHNSLSRSSRFELLRYFKLTDVNWVVESAARDNAGIEPLAWFSASNVQLDLGMGSNNGS